MSIIENYRMSCNKYSVLCLKAIYENIYRWLSTIVLLFQSIDDDDDDDKQKTRHARWNSARISQAHTHTHTRTQIQVFLVHTSAKSWDGNSISMWNLQSRYIFFLISFLFFCWMDQRFARKRIAFCVFVNKTDHRYIVQFYIYKSSIT